MRLMHTAFALVLGACSAGGPVVDSDPPGDSGGDEIAPPRAYATGWNVIDYDGRTRDFLLHVPASLAPNAPLVFVLHGYSDSAEAIERYSQMSALADQEGFVVVYPQGTIDASGYTYWEVGYAFHDGSVDDVGFLLSLRALLIADQGLDPTRVYATGMSNGGDMMYRLACEVPESFAAVAPVAGCLMGWLADSCAPNPELPLFEIHGTADRTTPWEGDMDGSDGYGPYYGTEASVGHFVGAYGLDVEEQEALPDLDPDDGSTVTATRWSSGQTPTEVWLYTIDGGGHVWPGRSGNQDFRASDAIWSFFQKWERE
jgi:polyhydroxybutyrate depolymerase